MEALPSASALHDGADSLWWRHHDAADEFDFRLLESTNSTTDNSTSTDGTSSVDDSFQDSQILRATFLVYGSALLVIVLVFCYVRLKYPRVYNLRAWVEEIKSPLALQEQKGFFSWIWKVYMIPEDELLQECGMDALCLVRMMQMGYRLSLVGIFNSFWLMPLYATAEESEETAYITDSIVQMTTAHVPSGSNRLIGTVLASYIFFGYAMYQVVQEFEWFIEERHKFLRRKMARNYAVFVRNIPRSFRSNQAVEEFFRGCFPHDSILEARLPMQASGLAKVEAKRDVVVTKLERAIVTYQKNPNNQRPTHTNSVSLTNLTGEQVDSIHTYQAELRELNREVSKRITELEHKANGTGPNQFHQRFNAAVSSTTGQSDVETPSVAMASGLLPVQEDATSVLTTDDVPDLPNNNTNDTTALTTMTAMPSSLRSQRDKHVVVKAFASSLKDIKAQVSSIAVDAVDDMQVGAFNVAGTLTSSAAALKSMALSNEDGKILSAGFVAFTKLSTANAARQMIHHQTPFCMEVIEAPDPEDINWFNVPRTHKDLQLGSLSSFAMSTALCVFWTVPMAFISSLSSVAALRKQIPAIDDLLNAFPFLEPIFQQLAPLLVVGLNAMLPSILEFITLFEGPISSAMVAASLFVKLAAFMIIQTFFISAISGGLFQEIHNIINNPASVIDLLANSLPAQSTYFMQIIFVGTVTSAGVELLRVVPLLLAALRQCIGPRVTEKDRQTTFMGIRPLCDPLEFQHADFASQSVLYFMVLLVYAVISPITCYVAALCFLIMGSIDRHQFIYIYPTKPDSGGRIWMGFIRTLLPCFLVAQVTIVGLLALKKAAIAVPLFIPLLIITILFSIYIRQMHFRVAEFLPTREGLKEDIRRGPDFDFSFLRGAYTQPELKAEKEVLVPSVLGEVEGDPTTSTMLGDLDDVLATTVYEAPRQQQPGGETGADEGEAITGSNNRSTLSSVLGTGSFFTR